MTVWHDQLGVSIVTGTTWTAVTGSPYMPQADARLRKIILALSGDAATSLIERFDLRLKCKTFGGVDEVISVDGGGIHTATRMPVNIELDVDLPVKAGVPITIEAKNNITSVTPNIGIIGMFVG